MSVEATRCNCGAVSFELNDQTYSCKETNLRKLLPKGTKVRYAKNTYYNCNHCVNHYVNHYGLDLCGCGSGEPPDECENEFDECGSPMQVIGEKQETVLWRR